LVSYPTARAYSPGRRPWVLLFVVLLCLVVGSPSVVAEETLAPTQGDIDAIRKRVERACTVVVAVELDATDRTHLQEQLRQIETALAHYEELSQRGSKRKAAEGPLYLAGVALLVDDTSGIGVTDDVLLPVIALGLLAAHLSTQPPVSNRELRSAWEVVLSRLQAAAGMAQLQMGKLSGKERASDIPSWAKGCKMKPGETPAQAADRILKDRYPGGNVPRGPGSEFNKIKKFFERAR
jgi:hypothetical protein